MASISVIIPTYNRASILERVLRAYTAQTVAAQIAEIIVVDDGSTDETRALLTRTDTHSAVPLRCFFQAHHGPGAARNVGIQQARGDILLFSDDDIIPTRTLVATHLAVHESRPEPNAAVLGQVDWSPDVKVTPFMRWYGSDILFHFGRLMPGGEVGFRYFYTCNVSLKANFVRDTGLFDEDFNWAAYEDIEFGFRLAKKGLELYYHPDALSFHYQMFSFADACAKARKKGLAREVFLRKEAGLWITSESNSRLSMWQKRLGYAAALPLLPLLRVVDSNLRFPDIVYKLLYHYCVRNTVRRPQR